MARGLSFRGVSATAVLLTAVAAGMVGGALTISAAQSDPAAPPAVTLHQVADEATAAPTPEPSQDPVTVEAPATVEAPVAIDPTKSTVDRAEEAADRAAADAAAAEAAAQRAKDAADRAEKPAAPAPTAEPKSIDPSPETGTSGPPASGCVQDVLCTPKTHVQPPKTEEPAAPAPAPAG